MRISVRAFNRDLYQNACEVEQWWRAHGGLTNERLAALIRCFDYVARCSYEQDRPTFEQAYLNLERLSPGYVPQGKGGFARVAAVIGYRNAEATAALYRRAKNILRSKHA